MRNNELRVVNEDPKDFVIIKDPSVTNLYLLLLKDESIFDTKSINELRTRSTMVMIEESFDHAGYEYATETLKDSRRFISDLDQIIKMNEDDFEKYCSNCENSKQVKLYTDMRRNVHKMHSSRQVITDSIESWKSSDNNKMDSFEDRIILDKLVKSKIGKHYSFLPEALIRLEDIEKFEQLEDSFSIKLSKHLGKLIPQWIHKKGSGGVKVDSVKLGEEILEELKLVHFSDMETKAIWNEDQGIWILENWSKYLDKTIASKLSAHTCWNMKNFNSVQRLVKSLSFEGNRENPFTHSNPNYINFNNGIYDLSKDCLIDHSPDYYLTQKRGYPIDVSGKTPEKTIDWLKDLVVDEETVTFLCEMIGYCYYRSYSPFQSVFLLYGKGQNGKSVFIEFLKEMFHSSNISNVMLQELDNTANRFSRAQLFQKEVNLFADIDSNHLSSTGVIKMLTGGDTMMAERKGEHGFSFINHAKLIFSANTLPTFSDASHGFHRRLEIVPFPITIDNTFIEKHNLDEIKKEIPIFSHYCIRAFADALNRKDFTRSKRMIEVKDRYVSTMDIIDRFLEDCCDQIREKDIKQEAKKIKESGIFHEKLEEQKLRRDYKKLDEEFGDSTKSLYDLFKQYCREEGAVATGKNKFKRHLLEHGHEVKRKKIGNKNVERYKGIFFNKEKAARLGYKFDTTDGDGEWNPLYGI